MRLRSLMALAAAALTTGWLATAAQAAETLWVFTSYPQAMMDRYQAAFSAKHPEIDLRFNWGHTAEALKVLSQPKQDGMDVFWSPSTSGFEILADKGAFRPITPLLEGIPATLGKQNLSDPQGRYGVFELASFGIIVNDAYLKTHKLPTPKRWADLADPVYKGHILMPAPSDVGFAHPLFETILQHDGWDKGWDVLTKMAANAVMVDHDGNINVLDEVGSGRKGVGMIFDFAARRAQTQGRAVRFTTPDLPIFSPARIAITADAPHAKAAETFVRFVLSDEGQTLLFRPDVSRLPVRVDVYAAAPQGFDNPFAGTVPFTYDRALAAGREAEIVTEFTRRTGYGKHDESVPHQH